jgi:hypothetical protein
VGHGDRQLGGSFAARQLAAHFSRPLFQIGGTKLTRRRLIHPLNQSSQLKQPPSLHDQQLNTLASPSVPFFSPPTTPLLGVFFCFSFSSLDVFQGFYSLTESLTSSFLF